jgi:hypothetical protein
MSLGSWLIPGTLRRDVATGRSPGVSAAEVTDHLRNYLQLSCKPILLFLPLLLLLLLLMLLSRLSVIDIGVDSCAAMLDLRGKACYRLGGILMCPA